MDYWYVERPCFEVGLKEADTIVLLDLIEEEIIE